MRAVLWVLIACCVSRFCSAAVRPEANAAFTFGVQLQVEFSKRHGDALVDHLNIESLRQRVFASFDPDGPFTEGWVKLWNQYGLPPVLDELKAFGPGYSLVLDRVGLIDHARWLQCVLVDKQGRFRILELRLCEPRIGEIAIDDLHFGGGMMEISRVLRHTLLLLGMRPNHTADAEELQVAIACERYLGLTGDLVRKVAAGDLNTAFQRLRLLPEDVQHTRIIQDYRNRLALAGHEGARTNLRDDLNSGRTRNAFLRFSFPEAADPKAALAILDQLTEEYHGSPFLRAVKAESLTNAGESGTGLELAEEVYGRNPFCFTAYPVAIHAALALHRPERAMLAVEAFARVFTPVEVDQVLATDRAFDGFRATPEYKAWLAKAPPPGAAPTS
jgi:hypothetical protein